MAIRKELKDSENYQLIAGLDEDEEAQELRFEEDRVKISVGESAIINEIQKLVRRIEEKSEFIALELKRMNTHLSIITDEIIGDKDVY